MTAVETFATGPMWAGFIAFVIAMLALDLFVFVMIFTYFAVPPELQRRVLLYGVLGAIVMRAGMILAGVWLVTQFAWILYVFGAFLVITGIKMIVFAEAEPDLEANPLLRWLRGHLRITPNFHGESFFVRRNGVLWATPMFLVLVFIGGKMLAMPWFRMPIQWSLAIVGSIILVSVLASLAFSKSKPVVAGEGA